MKSILVNRKNKILVFFVLGILSISTTLAKQPEKEYNIAKPPKELNLDVFYQKHSNVHGIHIISSHRVPDSAFVKACEIIDFMTSGLPKDILNQLAKVNTRVGIMARYEGTTDIPEHAHLENDTTLNWDVRARGLGGTLKMPLTTCAEENLLCYQIDKYHAEDILIHEFAHTIHGVGIIPLDDKFNDLLQEKLDAAMAAGKYKNTYAATNIWEYWAEGVQNWFNVNAEVEKVDGKHNWVNTREDMKKYDPDLYKIVNCYFPEFEGSPSCHSAVNLYQE